MRRSASTPSARLLSALALAALTAVLGVVSQAAWSQPARSATAQVPESGPKWSELSATQRNSLKPLERDWSTIDADRKEKWIEIAQRIPAMNPAERERI